MALAGGVAVTSQNSTGYLYQEGMIFSPDGHCRAFDARAKGTTGGNGAGIVLLKTLAEAIEDRDRIYAVIKGTAVNNDGKGKMGFTAPGIEGERDVIRTALQVAGIDPETLGYVETHGTGTILGDPVEIEGLSLAFNTTARGFCCIGSVKTNIGHLDAAAGIASLIKTVLVLEHRQIPACLHFETPNPKIDFENSPFYVNTQLRDWKRGKNPLRAGISSFGIGGTNAHLIIQEAPAAGISSPSRPRQLLLLSAKTSTALDKTVKRLAEEFKKNPAINVADAAYTLAVGRTEFPHRAMAVYSDIAEGHEILSSTGSEQLYRGLASENNQRLVFMFPGQGSQYLNMGWGLYREEPRFREEIDRCFDLLTPLLGVPVKEIVYPALGQGSLPCTSPETISQTAIAQPLLFAFEYALAKLVMDWDVRPYAMIGHSIGEFVAACLAGVFSLPDALALVCVRGQLMQEMPFGTMVSVPLSEETLSPILNQHHGLDLAAVNAPDICVVSGTDKNVSAFEQHLMEKGYKSTYLHTSHAFHSRMMEPVLGEFQKRMEGIKLNPPEAPFISNVTGKWITVEEAVNPEYWATHLRRTVRFSRGLKEVLKEGNLIFLEVGPGRTLCSYVQRHRDQKPLALTINLVRHPHEKVSDEGFLLNRLGHVWLYGRQIRWDKFYGEEKRNRIPLPTYPFERERYWIEGDFQRLLDKYSSGKSAGNGRKELSDWFYVASWERSHLAVVNVKRNQTGGNWLVFINEQPLSTRLLRRLIQEGMNVTTVRAGERYSKERGTYTINPRQGGDYDTLFKDIREANMIPDKILHLWGVTGNEKISTGLETLDRSQDLGLFSLMSIMQAIGKQDLSTSIRLDVVTTNMQEVIGEELEFPGKATILGAIKVIPLEYPFVSCRSIDIVTPFPGSKGEGLLLDHLMEEFNTDCPENVIAYRGNHRWIQKMKPLHLGKSWEETGCLREKGVYLIVGGFGGMGFTLAGYLGRSVKARLILVGRSPFPEKHQWETWVTEHSEEDDVSLQIRKLQQLESQGSEVMVFNADVADYQRMKEVISQVKKQFGKIHGVIHAAGIIDYAGVIQRRTREMTEQCLAAKVKGTLVLDDLLKDNPLDFLFLFSSIGNILYGGKFGQVGYNAANEFLDAFAYYKTCRDNTFTITINWSDWLELGMSVRALRKKYSGSKVNIDDEAFLPDALTPAEGIDVFKRILGTRFPRLVISTTDLLLMLREQERSLKEKDISSLDQLREPNRSLKFNQRPQLNTSYVAPRNEIEQVMVKVWQNFLGIEQVGINDNFFDLGASSLSMVQVNQQLNKALNRDLPLVTLFNYTTISSLAAHLIRQQSGEVFQIKKKDRFTERQKGKKSVQSRFQRVKSK
jgi:acyl transferase domain-containing protein/acyl carrier protein